jgi:hypothetical protein
MSGLTSYVTRVEIWDNYGFRMAVVEAKDEATATVNIEMGVTSNDWPELSAAILNAIKSMKLEGDEE